MKIFDKYGPFHILNSYLQFQDGLGSKIFLRNTSEKVKLKHNNWFQLQNSMYLASAKSRKIPGFHFQKSRDFHQPQIPGSRDSRDPAKACQALQAQASANRQSRLHSLMFFSVGQNSGWGEGGHHWSSCARKCFLRKRRKIEEEAKYCLVNSVRL